MRDLEDRVIDHHLQSGVCVSAQAGSIPRASGRLRSWSAVLASARQCPPAFVGTSQNGLVYTATIVPAQLLWVVRAFRNPERMAIHLSPCAYHVCAHTGPLVASLEKGIDWEDSDNLLRLTRHLGAQLPEPYRFGRRTLGELGFPRLDEALCPLYLASGGVCAIRTDRGLWCQCFTGGWPTSPPFLLSDPPAGVGLLVAAVLEPRWFPGLPFTVDATARRLPKQARGCIELVWHEGDDLLPEFPSSPPSVAAAGLLHRCLSLHPGTLARSSVPAQQ